MKIFWAWQSDTPGNIGRFFVRDVLKSAIQMIKSHAEVIEPTEREALEAMELDHDRKGVPGSPDLASTIMGKIEAAAVFVADVTSVGTVFFSPNSGKDEQPKKLINPNVAIEIGYSLRTRTDRSLLMVMNTHYGNRTDLPFDVAHKGGPIMFNLAPNADKEAIAAAAERMKRQLAEAIKLCIADEVKEKKAQEPFPAAKPFAGQVTYFAPGTVLASAGDPGEQNFHFPHPRIAYMRIHPANGTPPVGRAEMNRIFRERRPSTLSMSTSGSICSNNEFGPIVFDFDGTTSISALTQGFKTGELWGINGVLFRPFTINSPASGNPKPATVLPMVTFEKVFVAVLRNWVKVEAALKLVPPFTVDLGVAGLKDVYLSVPSGGSFGNGDILGPIREDAFRQTHTLQTSDDAAINDVLRKFFSELYDMANVRRSDAWTVELLLAHDLPSL